MKENVRIGFVLMMLISLSLLSGCAKPPFGGQGIVPGESSAQDKNGKDDAVMVNEPSIKGYEVVDDNRDGPDKGDDTESQQVQLAMVHFEFNKFTLTSETRKILVSNASYLQENKEVTAVLKGHCDDMGSDEYNVALGELRARAVKKYLVKFGISPDRLPVVSYGEESPLVIGSSEEARAKNRRVEFSLNP